MSSEKPVRFIHKSATVRSVDYSNAQFEVIYLSFLILHGRPADVARKRKVSFRWF